MKQLEISSVMDLSNEIQSSIVNLGKACIDFTVNGTERQVEIDVELLYYILQYHKDTESMKGITLNHSNIINKTNAGLQQEQSSKEVAPDLVLNNHRTIPPDILLTLGELNLDSKKVNLFSLTVDFLFNITILRITNNSNLQQLPESIGLLVNLKKLDLTNNALCELPVSMGMLKNITSINASSNNLTFLPDTFAHLNKLKCFNLSDNSFIEVPQCLYTGLPNVLLLDLCKNHITSFDWKPNCAIKLKMLKLNNNNLMHFPCWILDDTSKYLVDVNLSANTYMQGIRKEITILSSNLQQLNVSDCMLNNANANFLQGLKCLRCLNVGNKVKTKEDRAVYGNSFWDFPLCASDFCYLQEVVMHGVGLSMLPEDIGNLQALEYADFSSNSLNWIPETFCKLVTLLFTSLSNNEICFLPDQLGYLELLRELCLDGNRIYALPDSIVNLKNLEHLDLYDNLFESVPEKIFILPKLKRFDIELNYFDASESFLLDDHLQKYAEMKCSLRQYGKWNVQQRKDGRKPVSERCEVDPDSDKEYESSLSLTGESYPTIGSREFKEAKEIVEEEEEDWDLEVDFDENFDPSLHTVIPGRGLRFENKRVLFLVEDVRISPDYFCPSDKHVPSLLKLRNWYKLHSSLFTVEGQFDDAD